MLKITVEGPRRIDLDVPIPCPKCELVIEISARASGPGTRLSCPGCGATIELTGDDLREAQASLDGLLDTIHNLGR